MYSLRNRLHPATAAVLGLGLLLGFNALFTPGFFAWTHRDGAVFGAPIDVLKRGAETMILAAAATLVIATRGIDLSVGAIMAVSGASAGVLLAGGGSVVVAILGALGASLFAGLFNGLLVVGVRLPPIIATLVLMTAGRGAAQLLSDGQIVPIRAQAFLAVADTRFLFLPAPVWIAIGFATVTAIFAARTAIGLFVRATGDNPAAARAAGVRQGPLLLGLYAFSGLGAGIAGILAAADIEAADANFAGKSLELDAVLAVVLGGTSLSGGRFTVLGSTIGALLIQTLTTTLYMHDVPPDVASIPKALVVLAICAVQASTKTGRDRS